MSCLENELREFRDFFLLTATSPRPGLGRALESLGGAAKTQTAEPDTQFLV